ncbi:hypothetical protein D3C71_609360 [compost metagenome]
MIDQTLFLLERAVVLLVHHQQTQVGVGQEQGRARPDHDVAAPGDHRLPHLTALRRGHARVPFCWRCAEAGGDPFDQGLGQGDFGQQDQHLGGGIMPQRPRRRLQIGLGLARARHPVQQEGGETARRHGVRNGRSRGRLIRVQGRRGMVGIGGVEGGDRLDLDHRQHPLVDQALDHARRDISRARQVGAGHRLLAQGLQHRRPRRRGASGAAALDPLDPPLGAGTRRAQALQGRGRHLARRAQGPARRPFDEVQRPLRQTRIGQHLIQRLEFTVGTGRLEDLGHHAPDQTRPQRHGDLIAARDRQFLGNGIVEGFRHRQGNEDGGDFHAAFPPHFMGRWRGASRRDGGGVSTADVCVAPSTASRSPSP